MQTAPDITIFVRHKPGCKYEGDETAKRCACRKHLRWSANGIQHRRKANTRSWAEAEAIKRSIEDELSGKTAATAKATPDLRGAVALLIQDKQVQGVSPDVIAKYRRLLDRLCDHCEVNGIFTPRGISRDALTGFCALWPRWYPSSVTRAKQRERLRSFLRYCYEAQWVDRIQVVPRFKIDEPETQPLTPEEYRRLLDAVFVAIDSKRDGPGLQRLVLAFLETMRWTGLAIRDTMTLRRDALTFGKLAKITTARAKTGTPVSIPVPPAVADALLALPTPGEYFFWTGNGNPQSATKNWGQRYIAPCFKEAGIVSDGHMVSHRLRDTFAVDLLEKGVPMEEVSRLLGHTSIRTTEKHYAKWSKGRQDRVDDLVSATW